MNQLIDPSIHRHIDPSIRRSVDRSVDPSIHPSIHLSIHSLKHTAAHVAQLYASAETPSRRALAALYSSAGGASWTSKGNWMTNDPCTNSWYGVAGYCASGREVERVYLGDTNLAGSLPTQIGYLTSVSAYFRIDYNSLHGALPTQFGKLSKLTYDLYLRVNSMNGTLPTQVRSPPPHGLFPV